MDCRTIVSIIATCVTAVATVFLAVYNKRMIAEKVLRI